MKKVLIAMTALAIVGASSPLARAGDREWATAGKVLAGVGAGLLLTHALEARPVYEAPPVYVNPAPVVVQAQPVVVQPQPVQVVVPTVPVQQVVVQQTVPVQTVQTVVTQPVVIQQQPVYVQPAPIIYQPAPVVVAAPVVVRPPYVHYARPLVGVSLSFGHHHRPHGRGW